MRKNSPQRNHRLRGAEHFGCTAGKTGTGKPVSSGNRSGDWREQADRRIASSCQGQRFADDSAYKGFSAVFPCRPAYYSGRVEHIFSDDSIRKTLAYVQAAAAIGLMATFSEQFRQGVGVTKIITLAEELPATLLNYKSGTTACTQDALYVLCIHVSLRSL